MEDKLKDPKFADKLTRFLKASIKGWQFAMKNPDEAADIVLENDETGAQTEKHQRRMMRKINKLVEGNPKGIGYLVSADYERTVDVLLQGGNSVISKRPEGAWTHDIWNKAMGM